MKARPRAAEREIGRYLSNLTSALGMDEFERIPILGRTGPDLTINQSMLVIDIKSRLECPKRYFVDTPTAFKELIALPLHQILTFDGMYIEKDYSSKMVQSYWSHMDEWTQKKEPDGISAIILHRPHLAYKNSVIIFHTKDNWRFLQTWKFNKRSSP